METIDFIAKRYNIDLNQRSPIHLLMVRDELGVLFRDLGFKTGAEVGVEQGVFSEILCKANPGMKMYCIDAWEAYQGYRDHVSQEKLDGFYEDTKRRLERYNCSIIRGFSSQESHSFADHSLDFVYIDGNHEFFQVTQDIACWAPKVRKGGILCGHDFKRDKGRDWVCHVKDVVQAWAYSHQINSWFVLHGGGNSSWMWVC